MAAKWLVAIGAVWWLTACAGADYPLWSPDARAAAGPSGQPSVDPGAPADRPTLDYGARRWQGGEPEIYRAPPEGAGTAGAGADVLAPRDPGDPHTAMGGGYTRHGTTIIGPRGESHSIVGSTVFGPDGRPCSVVGDTLFCN